VRTKLGAKFPHLDYLLMKNTQNKYRNGPKNLSFYKFFYF
jgi:hypothetical protein